MIDNLLNVVSKEHLYFLHLFLGGYGVILLGMCLFESNAKALKWIFTPSAFLMAVFSYVLAFMKFSTENNKPEAYLIKITIFSIISFLLVFIYLLALRKNIKPYPIGIALLIIFIIYFASIQTSLSYFSTFCPIVFSFMLLTIFGSKYHQWNFSQLFEIYISYFILLFPTVLIFYQFLIFFGFNEDAASIISISGSFFTLSMVVIAVWVKTAIYRKMFYRIKMEKDLYESILDETSMNPFASQKSFLNSFFDNMKNLGNFDLLSILLINDKLNYGLIMREDKEREKIKLSLPKEILPYINNMMRPVTKSMLLLSDYPENLLSFFRESTHWKLVDYILPVRDEKNIKLLLFINHNNPSENATKYIHFLSFLQRILEFILFSADKLKTDNSLKELFTQTTEKQFSYERMLEKVEQVNEAYNKLQEKQQQLIESERWISLSQISVTLNHEINNPLTLILGLAQLIQMKEEKGLEMSDDEFIRDLNLISEQSKRIVNIIKSLRKISVPVIEKYLPNIEMIKLDINNGEN